MEISLKYSDDVIIKKVHTRMFYGRFGVDAIKQEARCTELKESMEVC